MMEDRQELAELDQLRDRINAIQGYRWEGDAFHSSYDNWHFYGVKLHDRPQDRTIGSQTASRRGSPDSPESRPTLKGHRSSNSESNISTISDLRALSGRTPEGASQPAETPDEPVEEPLTVVARVSTHIFRLEREYQLSNLVISQSDPNCEHFVRPIELVHLNDRHGQEPLIVSIFEAPGPNYLRDIAPLGPNVYKGVVNAVTNDWEIKNFGAGPKPYIPLLQFLDFAVGAAECLEILHYGNQMVHGELRGDAFHFNVNTGEVKMLNFGSGVRSFENGLTSAGWSALAREKGVNHKLQFIAPEQTGRLPAEPDLRTDIYSLGVLFWTMLTDEPAFEGSNPLDIMQNVLSRRIPSLSSRRMDMPEALSTIVQKMTQKNIEDRYRSTTGLKHDLIRLRELLSEGDTEGLKSFVIATKDISCSFTLPTHLIGRDKERLAIVNIIETVSKKQRQGLPTGSKLYSISSNSSLLSDRPIDELVSDSTSSRGSDSRFNSVSRPSVDATQNKSPQRSQDSIVTSDSSTITDPLSDRQPSESLRNSTTFGSSDLPTPLFRSMRKLKRKGKCEIIAIAGQAGLGKSSLVQSIQPLARAHGYFSSAKFDQIQRSPYDAILRLLSSLFRQIFSEADVSTEFHEHIRRFVSPFWSILHGYLDLPEWLLNSGKTHSAQKPVGLPARRASVLEGRRASSPALPLHCGSQGNTAADFLRTGGSVKASRFRSVFLDVLQMLAVQRFICFCVDDLQFADEESLELIMDMVANKLPIVMILTYRPETLPEKIAPILSVATNIQLSPFTEDETAEYVCATMLRDPEYVLPLVAVIQEKTSGNPFFVREFLDTCNRKKCIFYDWKDSTWQFDINRGTLLHQSP